MCNAMCNEEVFTFSEFMEFIRVKKSTMYRIMQSPYAPHFTQIGTRKIITRRDAIRWVEDNAGSKIF